MERIDGLMSGKREGRKVRPGIGLRNGVQYKRSPL